VTALDESERVIDGAPVVTPEPPGVTWKPMVPETATLLMVVLATTRSAPLALEDEGASWTTAWPLLFVRAELVLNVPRPPAVEKVMTCPETVAPVEL
jgi:hypothetical protein